MLNREEYIEQAYFFRTLGERAERNVSTQELLATIREEVLSTTKLPFAVDFLAAELKHQGVFAPAMAKLSHYFAPFQTFVVEQAESEKAKFDFASALVILEREAKYRAEGVTPQGLFLYQFEVLCRHRLGYDKGLDAIGRDAIYDGDWREWIDTVRRQVGIVDFADMIYVRSARYLADRQAQGHEAEPEKPILFGEKEGKIALSHRRKDPIWMFAALQRQLGYPEVPRPKSPDEGKTVIPHLMRRVERLESRVKLLEEEQAGGIDLTKFYTPPPRPTANEE